MSDLKSLREELRRMRKESVKPVSKMRKGDISAEIERMKGMRAETPAVAAVPSAPPKKSKAAAETIKEAKATEFPVAPEHHSKKKTAGKSSTGASKHVAGEDAGSKKKDKLAKLKQMLAEMSDSE